MVYIKNMLGTSLSTWSIKNMLGTSLSLHSRELVCGNGALGGSSVYIYTMSLWYMNAALFTPEWSYTDTSQCHFVNAECIVCDNSPSP